MRFNFRRVNRLPRHNSQVEQFESRCLLSAVMTVNTTIDSNVRDNFLTLRESILVSNRTLAVATLSAAEQAQVSGTPTATDTDTIAFNIPAAGVQTITPTSALPALTDPAIIDGYTQPGASANTLVVGNNTVLLIEVNGASAGGSANGFSLSGGGSTIRGLVVNRFASSGVEFLSNNNVVEGNYLGVDSTGTIERGNSFAGVFVSTGSNNRIGGTTSQSRNVFAANGSFVGTAQIVVGRFGFANAVGTVIRGNYIGINPSGTSAVHTTENGSHEGIYVVKGDGTIIGGGDADDGVVDGVVLAGNVISGNSNGIRVDPTSGDTPRVNGITIQGNIIGLNATGTTAVGNFGDGIFSGTAIYSNNMQIGGTQAGAGNIISGNDGDGFRGGALSMVIEGNLVGTDISGTLDRGNGNPMFGNVGRGIYVTIGGSEGPNYQITVGGTTPAARNVISGNLSNGVYVTGIRTGTVTVQGNYIGTQIDGLSPLPNDGKGIEMNRNVVVGGTVPGAGNVIAFNKQIGVFVPTPYDALSLVVPILGNSIFLNGTPSSVGLGIAMNNTFFFGNDPGDADGGQNNSQNFPEIASATLSAGMMSMQYQVPTFTANATYPLRVEFFKADSDGQEGRTFLGFDTYTAVEANTTKTFTFAPTAGVVFATGDKVVGTATDADGRTSLFSTNRLVTLPLPTLSVSDVSANEGISGTMPFMFTVTLSANPTSNVTVTVNTANGTINPATTADNDYVAISNLVLTFVPNGSLTQTVTVNVNGDSKFERDETFFVNLSNATGATIADNQGLGTILNDDLAPTMSFSVNNSVLEGNVAADDRKVPFTITLSAVSGVDVTGTVNTISGTATEGVDFESADGVTFLIPAGQTTAIVYVNVIEDTDNEPDEQFTITATVTDLTTVSNANGTVSGTGTILNDDAPPTLTINDVSRNEGNSGTTAFTFTVTLSANPASNVSVTVNTANGTTNPATTVDGDYAAISNLVLTFVPNGPLTQTVTVNVNGDAKFERNETFFVNLSNPVWATIANGQGLGTILNEDAAPTLSFSLNNSVQEGNVAADDRKVPFTISLSAVSGVDVAGTISTTSGTATEGVDFVSADGVTFVIPAGQTSATINVSVIEDTTVEPDEQFTITAVVTDPTTVSNVNGTASGTGTILNDDFSNNPSAIIGGGCDGPALIINGSQADDTIRVVPQGQNAVKVLINGQNYGTFAYASFQEIIIYGRNGNDDIELAGHISTPAFLFGEAGNDRLKGGNGPNVLVGGNGDDELIGSQSADVLIGGNGSDRLVGNGGDDLLIAGWTDHDTNLAALCAILDEWSRTDVSYASRVSHLQFGGGRNGSVRLTNLTVHDDRFIDKLTGSAGCDWFFANTDGCFLDQITDRHSAERVDDI